MDIDPPDGLEDASTPSSDTSPSYSSQPTTTIKATPQTPSPTSPTTRINDLLTLDTTIPLLLQSASSALRALTTPPSAPQSSTVTQDPLAAQKQAFETHTLAFYTHIQSLSAHLRRQIYALEEARIIAPEAPSKNEGGNTANTANAANQGAPRPAGVRGASGPGDVQGMGISGGAEPPMQLTNGGMGSLGVGWLNSRRDEVGLGKEGELWRDARVLVQSLLEQERERTKEKANGKNSEGRQEEGEKVGVDDMDENAGSEEDKDEEMGQHDGDDNESMEGG